MIKKVTAFLGLLAITGWAGIANASPIQWTFGDSENLSGSFVFDSSSNTFSSVSFDELHFGDSYSSATGTATSLFANSNTFGDQTSLTFLTALTDLGGSINFTGSTICSDFCLDDNGGLNTFVGTVSAPRSAVPVPATLALFGLGLAGLGWSRRKQA